jgi:hypothetical protein
MLDFIRDGGFGIIPVMLFGLASIVLAARYAHAPKKGDLALLVGVGVATILLGVLGTVIGVQAAARFLESTPDKWLFVQGLREALNLMVTALVATALETIVATYGAVKLARREAPVAAEA